MAVGQGTKAAGKLVAALVGLLVYGCVPERAPESVGTDVFPLPAAAELAYGPTVAVLVAFAEVVDSKWTQRELRAVTEDAARAQWVSFCAAVAGG